MPAKLLCKICQHKKRVEIERALADPTQSNRAIAKQFGVVARTLDRHKLNCTRVLVQQAIVRQERALGVDIADRVESLQSKTELILEVAMMGLPLLDKSGAAVLDPKGKPILVSDGGLALKAIAQARHNYRLIAQLTGKLTPAEDETKRLPTFEEFALIYRRVVLKEAA
jgi:hypothetical protein